MPQITRSQLAAFAPNVPYAQVDTFVEALNAAFAKYGIDQSWRRIRYYMAQSYHETQGYTKFVEDMTYKTASRLPAVWPSRFTMDPNDKSKAYAPDYINNAEKLANLVYANRMGNGDPISGDGWRFRGRGAFHLTGQANYLAYSMRIYGDRRIVSAPDLVMAPKDAFMSGTDYWDSTKYVEKDSKGNVIKRWAFNELADADKFTFMSIAIQGSDQSVDQRLSVLRLANATFKD